MKFILYSVCYDNTEPGEGVRIYNIKKVAEFEERTEKAGSWKEQAGALERAANNCGICAIR